MRTDNSYPNATVYTVSVDGERNYTHYYDTDTYTSLWVAYPLEARHMGEESRPTSWSYHPDIDQAYQVDLRSKSYNGDYSRGHLIPNGSRDGIKEMQKQTFYVTNSVPQLQDRFNGSIWNSLENAVQAKAATSTLYIVTGAAFQKEGETKQTITYTTAQNDTKQVPVPNYYYKVVLEVTGESNGTVTSAQAIGFWFEHREYYSESYTTYSVSVDQIEAWTGFDFFHNLPDGVEVYAESSTVNFL